MESGEGLHCFVSSKQGLFFFGFLVDSCPARVHFSVTVNPDGEPGCLWDECSGPGPPGACRAALPVLCHPRQRQGCSPSVLAGERGQGLGSLPTVATVNPSSSSSWLSC